MSAPSRVFLDANVLYSAAIGGGVRSLWSVPDAVLVTSEYAAGEAWENLETRPDRARSLAALSKLLEHTELVAHDSAPAERSWTLPDKKDIPILQAAINANCQLLLTGDRRCFGALFGRQVEGVTILLPADYLRDRMPPV